MSDYNAGLADALWSDHATIDPQTADALFADQGGGMDPNLMMAGANVLGKALSGGGGTSKSDQSLRNDITLDNSGWNVTTGSGSIDSARAQTSSDQWVLLAGGLIVLVVAWRALKK